MKTTLSIMEALMFNLFPPELAAQVLLIVKNIIPLLGLILIRVWLYMTIFFQKLNDAIYYQLNEPVEEENLQWSLRYKQD